MIAVVGGGAAGFFAAIHAAMAGNKVVILEKSNKLLAKVRVSGGGRCNVTNGVETIAGLLEGYPRGSKELRGPFTRFNNQDTMRWFEERGVKLKIEEDGRVFPISDNSLSIVNCLMTEASALGVRIELNVEVNRITQQHGTFRLQTNGGMIDADKVIVTAGGAAKTDSYGWLSVLGLKIIKPVPSLFTFNVPDSPFLDLMGLSVQDAIVTVSGSKFKSRGAILFTHWGLSGPAVLRTSATAARFLNESGYQFEVLVDFLPNVNADEMREQIRGLVKVSPSKKVESLKWDALSSRLWERICKLSDMREGLDLGNLSNQILNRLVESVKRCRFQVSGKTTFKEEFVTCGGVSLDEIDFKSMESKRVPGLYFAGEVLDIDGITGGYNFQAAWTTGFISGTAAGSK
jgi:predicted Rossmann fold flavoprotein